MAHSSTRTCRGCDGPMPEGAHFNAKFCTKECKAKFRTEYMKDYKQNRPDHSGRTCEWLECSNIIPSSDGRVKFCSDECAYKANRKRLREYESRPEVKARMKELASTPDRVAKRQDYEQERSKLPHRIEESRVRSLEYHRRPEVMERSAEFRQTEEYRQRERDRAAVRNATPERRAYMSEYGKAYLQSEHGKEVVSRLRSKRRAIQLRAFVEDVSRSEIVARDGNECYLCGELIPSGGGHIDHLIPLSRGGTHEPNNVAMACAMCNYRKGAKILPEAIQKRGQNMMDSLREALQ